MKFCLTRLLDLGYFAIFVEKGNPIFSYYATLIPLQVQINPNLIQKRVMLFILKVEYHLCSHLLLFLTLLLQYFSLARKRGHINFHKKQWRRQGEPPISRAREREPI